MIADVVVPVYRGVASTRACLRSVLEHSGAALGRLVIVDDASPEPAMQPMLAELRDAEPRIVLIRNEQNVGFVSSANRGLSLRARDVVLLNSDTVVTPGWLDELTSVAESSDRIAAVVPLSNNRSEERRVGKECRL